ncbi:MAG TPA: protein-L-isoaspartate(D-aspartate) O-methyltransferase [Casimicrobiaceae bacterium]|nr:protein-L-isoaspartate(D-aspartate) O-methyltransferase [Casimicrobiaceae bacterium]
MARTKVHLVVAAFVASLLGPLRGTAATDEVFARERRQMVDEIAAMARSTRHETGRERFAERVMDAMGKVPRHRFVPERVARSAYGNHPLPIGEGQTISQPYIVALSTDLIDPQPEHVVLEIGTGSGYQAAVLAELVKHVYSIEIVEPLGKSAADRLVALGYRNVTVRIGDGYQGWAEHAPFDGIIVTAAAPFIPEPLVAQLKPTGRMVIPVESPRGGQDLLLVEKSADGTVSKRVVLQVRFVPMTGKGANERRR